MKSTVYLVVTVTMNRRQVAVPVVRSISIDVMEFDQVFRLEEESARLGSVPVTCESHFRSLPQRLGWHTKTEQLIRCPDVVGQSSCHGRSH